MNVVAVLLAAVLASVPLEGGFGEASASASEISASRVEVEVIVEVPGVAGGSVVAHLIEPGGEQQTVALRDRGGGEFGAFFETRKVDLVVVFELVRADPLVSRPVTLTELGVEREMLGLSSGPAPLVEVLEAEGDSEATRWGWLGLALGAASLSLLAFWVLGARDEDEIGEGPEGALASESGPPTT